MSASSTQKIRDAIGLLLLAVSLLLLLASVLVVWKPWIGLAAPAAAGLCVWLAFKVAGPNTKHLAMPARRPFDRD